MLIAADSQRMVHYWFHGNLTNSIANYLLIVDS